MVLDVLIGVLPITIDGLRRSDGDRACHVKVEVCRSDKVKPPRIYTNPRTSTLSNVTCHMKMDVPYTDYVPPI